jgi:hypothetical protein
VHAQTQEEHAQTQAGACRHRLTLVHLYKVGQSSLALALRLERVGLRLGLALVGLLALHGHYVFRSVLLS